MCYDSNAAEYDENFARAFSPTDTCTHEEKHWEPGFGFVCSICYKPMSGIGYSEMDRIEREHEARMEAEAKNYVPDGF